MNAAINDLPVEIKDRDQAKLDVSHDRMTFKMQSTTEQGKWERVFPNPMPATHYLHVEWVGNVLTIEPRVKQSGELSPGVPSLAPAPDAELQKLAALTEPQLLTLAAERSVPVQVDAKGKFRGTKAQLVAIILNHKATQATA